MFGSPEIMMPEPPYSPVQYTALSLGSFACFAFLRMIVDRLLFQPLGRSVILQDKERKLVKLPAKRQAAVDKFTESLWKFLVYTTLWCFALWALHDKAWLWDTTDYWKGLPNQLQSRRVHQLLFTQTGFYISSIFMLQFWETRRKDYPVMLGHHFSTLFLLLFAYGLGYDRAGSVVLLLHDFSDILLELAKLFNYAGWDSASMVTFVSMAASWLFLRLIVYPRNVVYSTMFEHQLVHNGEPLRYWWAINGLLTTLVFMHVYWFYLILLVAAKAVQGEQKDVREGDD